MVAEYPTSISYLSLCLCQIDVCPSGVYDQLTVRGNSVVWIWRKQKRVAFYAWNLFYILLRANLLFYLPLLPLCCGSNFVRWHHSEESLGILNFVVIKNLYYMRLWPTLVKFVSFLTGKTGYASSERKRSHHAIGCHDLCQSFLCLRRLLLEAPMVHLLSLFLTESFQCK